VNDQKQEKESTGDFLDTSLPFLYNEFEF